MPGGRRFRRKYVKKETNLQLTKDVTKLKKLMKVVKPPLKYVTYGAEITPIPFQVNASGDFITPGWLMNNGITVGAGFGQNLQYKATSSYLKMRGLAYSRDLAVSYNCRILILRDKEYNNNSNPLVVFQGTNDYPSTVLGANTGSNTATTFGEMQLEKPRRFDVLYDKQFILSPANTMLSWKHISIHVNLKNHEDTYVPDLTSSTLTPNSSAYMAYFICTGTGATVNAPLYMGNLIYGFRTT